jgi:hypothetical protein
MPTITTAAAPSKGGRERERKRARKPSPSPRRLSIVTSADRAGQSQWSQTSRKERRRRRPGEERRKSLSPDCLNREAWCAWIDSHLRVDDDHEGTYLFNGHPLGESDGRSLYRWRREDVLPSFWTADAWCCRYGLHVNEFLRWCEEPCGGLARSKEPRFCAWALGRPPAWETAELSNEELAEIEAAWPDEDEEGSEPLAA